MTDLPSGTVTFLFTDVESSTQLLRALGEYRSPEQCSHDALIVSTLIPRSHDSIASTRLTPRPPEYVRRYSCDCG
jgi:hypothetical protein